MVTNSLTFLSSTDQIIVLKNGSISETGTFNELMESNGYFSELIKQYSNNTLDKNEEKELDKIRKMSKSGTINESNIDKSKLVEVERVETGRVDLSVYSRYFKSISWFWCFMTVLIHALMQSAQVGSSVWLSKWSESNDKGVIDKTMFYLLIYGKSSLKKYI